MDPVNGIQWVMDSNIKPEVLETVFFSIKSPISRGIKQTMQMYEKNLRDFRGPTVDGFQILHLIGTENPIGLYTSQVVIAGFLPTVVQCLGWYQAYHDPCRCNEHWKLMRAPHVPPKMGGSGYVEEDAVISSAPEGWKWIHPQMRIRMYHAHNYTILQLGGGNSNIFGNFTPIWGRFSFWLIFFNWVETTN